MNVLRKWTASWLALAAFVIAVGGSASAGEYAGSLTVGRMFFSAGPGTQTIILFAVTPPPSQTCSYYGVQFQFDTSTPQGKSWYALLLTAKATGKPIDIWYENSTTPGTNETNGCTPSTVSVVDAIGLSN
jgi:hypothetical protein